MCLFSDIRLGNRNCCAPEMGNTVLGKEVSKVCAMSAKCTVRACRQLSLFPELVSARTPIAKHGRSVLLNLVQNNLARSARNIQNYSQTENASLKWRARNFSALK